MSAFMRSQSAGDDEKVLSETSPSKTLVPLSTVRPQRAFTVQMLQASVDPGDGESHFRFLYDGTHVKYVTIEAGLYTVEDMCFEPLLLPLLPSFPLGDWNYGYIARSSHDGRPCFTEPARRELRGITNIWHPILVDYLSLTIGDSLRANVHQVASSSFPNTVIAKFANFEWETDYHNDETALYQWIDGLNIGPQFLGHIVEEGRVIGFLLENILDSRHAEINDLELCQEALTRLHQHGIVHGDLNKHNILITGGRATLIDFECARKCDNPEEFEKELQGLAAQLKDTSGRGGRIEQNIDDDGQDEEHRTSEERSSVGPVN